MGKLQDALRRVKEQSAGRPPGLRRAAPGGAAGTAQQLPVIWPSAHRYECNPKKMSKAHIIGAADNSPSAAMSYNMLRTRLIQRMRDNDWRSFVVTSPDPGAGKTVTALNLAFSIAREQNQRVYLVDADLRVPDLHHYLGIVPESQLTDYLDGKSGIDDIVSVIGVDRLFLFLNGVQHEHSAELLTSPRMQQFVRELAERDPAGLMIYDAPPILAADDVLAFSPYVDAVLMVVAEGITEREDLAKSLQVLGEANLLGIVLNRSRDISHDAYY